MNFKKLTPLLLIVIAMFAGLATLASSSDRSSAPDSAFAPLQGSLEEISSPAVGPKVVNVGLYGTNVYELSFVDNTYYFSGYIWMRWTGDLSPTSSLEFVNAVETWGLMVTPLTEEPEQLSNGDFAQTLSVQGRFYKAFDLANYPLDAQTLTIMLEDSTNTADSIVYKVDDKQSGLDPNMRVQGFDVSGLSSQSYLHNYGTDFGYTGSENNQKYSAVEFRIHIDRDANLFLWKLLLPLLLVLITNWLTLLMNPKFVEVRTAMPATALLTTVFLQLSAMESVSQASTLVLMDKIYLVAYASIVLTLGQVIWDNRSAKEEVEGRAEEISRRDRISLISQAIVTISIFAVLILPRLL